MAAAVSPPSNPYSLSLITRCHHQHLSTPRALPSTALSSQPHHSPRRVSRHESTALVPCSHLIYSPLLPTASLTGTPTQSSLEASIAHPSLDPILPTTTLTPPFHFSGAPLPPCPLYLLVPFKHVLSCAHLLSMYKAQSKSRSPHSRPALTLHFDPVYISQSVPWSSLFSVRTTSCCIYFISIPFPCIRLASVHIGSQARGCSHNTSPTLL